MKVVYERPKSLRDVPFTYCAGCTHGIIHRLIAETLDELDIREKTIGVSPVGCSVFAYEFFNCDMVAAAHGRAPAVATGIKRVHPDRFVFTYQGDGDLAAIGTAETIHAATRGERITVIFVNNVIYGMTGGQMAPTTLIGQKTDTAPYGRDAKANGFPIKVCELLQNTEGIAYLERVSTHSPKHVIAAKRAIKKAFQYQMEDKGFTLIELLSTCPSNWGLNPIESLKWLEDNMLPAFPLGVYKDVG
jgi:2-oxoglutarate/2-oxoacid ferredoxin oxidoreductase subunit beta